MPILKSKSISNSHKSNQYLIKPQKIKSLSKHNHNLSINTTIYSQKNIRINEISTLIHPQNNTHKSAKFLLNQPHSSIYNHKQHKKSISNTFSKKQLIDRQSLIEELKNKKYIFNEPKTSNLSNKFSMSSNKVKTPTISMHSKNFSNKKLLNINSKKVNPLNTKLKKKAGKYQKSFTRTGNIQKSAQQLPYQKRDGTIEVQNIIKLELQKQKNQSPNLIQNYSLQKIINFIQFNSIELQTLKYQHQYKLYQIKISLNKLLSQLSSKNKSEVISIQANYQQIIKELYQILQKQNQQNTHQISLLNIKNANSSFKYQENTNKSTASQQSDINKSLFDNQKLLQNDLGQTNLIQASKSTPASPSTKSLIKKLNLSNLRQSLCIREYHQEFLEMKQNFSQSWKRQLQKEKQF